MKDYKAIFYVFLVLLIIIYLMLYCYGSIAKRVPYNYLLLFGFMLFSSYILGYACSMIS